MLSAPAIASELQGVAFSQAAESGTYHCRNTDAATAMACAKLLCEANADNECVVTNYCWPAQYSAVVKFHGDDLQYDISLCGQASVAALLQSAKANCLAQRTPGDCFVIKLMDPAGDDLPPPAILWKARK
ncbi:MAG: hypothetical protein COA52_20535 [Hyphomicrobiales bacterium]|nr:MAG: hypothetical protein COA52_20535 [Hyphomicrobiales bacterium]